MASKDDAVELLLGCHPAAAVVVAALEWYDQALLDRVALSGLHYCRCAILMSSQVSPSTGSSL